MWQNDTNNSFKEIAHKRSSLMLSSLKSFYKPIVSKGFAVKFVTEGVEQYHIEKEIYKVGAGSYLLANSISKGFVEVDSRKPVKGICINIDNDILEHTLAGILRPDAAIPDADLAKFFTSSLFIESTYQAGQTQLGKSLMQFNDALNAGSMSLDNLSAEFFYSISEKIAADYTPVCRQLQNIPAVKPATKKELYKKILRGKEFIDACFATPLSIEAIAKECCMSEYHFFRLFKQVFKLSPQQYIIRKRLENGKQILEQYQTQVSVAAVECGFSDIHSFSTAFRSHFGCSPSSLLLKNSRIS